MVVTSSFALHFGFDRTNFIAAIWWQESVISVKQDKTATLVHLEAQYSTEFQLPFVQPAQFVSWNAKLI
jgi:hypothetical protein